MRSLALALIAAAYSVAGAAVLPQVQCAVCPKQIGPDKNGTVYPLQGASTQQGAPTVCFYSVDTSRVCWYSPGGVLIASQSNALCPPTTTTAECPPRK